MAGGISKKRILFELICTLTKTMLFVGFTPKELSDLTRTESLSNLVLFREVVRGNATIVLKKS